MHINQASRHRRHELLRSGLNSFIANACENSKQRLNWHFAEIHLNKTLVQKCLSSLIYYTQTRKTVLKKKEIAEEFRHYCKYKIVWNKWCKKIVQRRQSTVKWNLTEALYERVLLKKHFVAFRDYVAAINAFRREINDFTSKKTNSFMTLYFKQWMIIARNRNSHTVDAEYFLQRNQQIKFQNLFLHWLGAARSLVTKRNKLDRLVKNYTYYRESSKIGLKLDMKGIFLYKWSFRFQKSLQYGKLCRKADQFKFKRFGRHSLMVWKRMYRHKSWLDVLNS